ncbi:unnamed protein product [Cylicocyclus nassatus]|uniref:WAP domain-containing protein n=1 Tax=Cylicocyclus nassatus TaxID=53992 RepID=A0AA36DN27_CYLNA|nr:unnamed protein product [Cylicocyclus nassatus]
MGQPNSAGIYQMKLEAHASFINCEHLCRQVCPMIRELALLMVLYILVPYTRSRMDWCQYFRLLEVDHLRPECNGIYRKRVVKQIVHPSVGLPPLPRDLLPGFHRFKQHRDSVAELTRRTLGLRNCSGSVSNCRESRLCHKGLMCYASPGYCCLDLQRITSADDCISDLNDLQCNNYPHPSALCLGDYQCSHTLRGKCCPSICGHSVCI